METCPTNYELKTTETLRHKEKLGVLGVLVVSKKLI